MFNRRKKMLEHQRALVAAHFAEVENMYRQMRAWRHDYHNHMQILSALLDGQNYGEARVYLDKMNQSLASVDRVLKTGNTVVDAILNSKLSLFASKGIPVTADAKVPPTLAVDDLDLCIIIGNLLDNALDACVPLDKPFVRIYIAPKKNNTKIAAGAVVLSNIPENSTAVGIPARVVRQNNMKVNDLDQVHIPDPVSQEFCRMNIRLAAAEKKLAELAGEN